MSEALSTADLLADIRARLASEVAGATVSERLGDRPAAAVRHQYIEIVAVDAGEPHPGDMQQLYIKCDRTVRLRWSYKLRSDNTDADALAFAAAIRKALVGNHSWAKARKLTYGGEPVAIAREGGYYTGALEVVSTRGLPTGGP